MRACVPGIRRRRELALRALEIAVAALAAGGVARAGDDSAIDGNSQAPGYPNCFYNSASDLFGVYGYKVPRGRNEPQVCRAEPVLGSPHIMGHLEVGERFRKGAQVCDPSQIENVMGSSCYRNPGHA